MDENGAIYDGTVGWEDGEEHFEDVDGVTLVKVTLFEGAQPDQQGPKQGKRARGIKIQARISGPFFYIPPDGAQVVVLVPAHRITTPGGPVIAAVPQQSPSGQFSGSRGKVDLGPETDLIFKAKSITFTDYENRYLTIGPRYGFKVGDESASGCQLKGSRWTFYAAEDEDAKAVMQLAPSAIKINHKDSSDNVVSIVMEAGSFTALGTVFKAQFGAGYLGKFVGGETTATNGIAAGTVGPANVTAPLWLVSLAI